MSKASHNGRQPAVAGLRRLATVVPLAILIAMSPTLLCQPLDAGAASPRWPAALAQDVAASTDYTLSRQFAPARGNQQGLAFQGGALYVSYDSGDGINGRIRSSPLSGGRDPRHVLD